MSAGIKRTFLLIAIFQALHSIEEYVFELWDHLAPARFVSGLFSDNLPFGFAVANCMIVAFVFLTYFIPVQRNTGYAIGLLWFWAILETLNGLGHLWFSFESGEYFPGFFTAPFLLLFGGILIGQLTIRRNAT
ncbi:MAG: HXXEE domain-containing protein [Woeseia sp.]|nr:HXXEE domain-containing protein [Woeseia sp.]MBT8097647.1 HXXEE domain-containing protein [Woeseia sp.]